MKIYDFCACVDLNNKAEFDKATLLCLYHYKETGEKQFNIVAITELFSDAALSTPNTSRLKKNLIDKKKMRIPKGLKTSLEFVPATFQALDAQYGHLWNDCVTIISDSELIDEVKFSSKYPYLSKLIKQINACYQNNCFDACAVIMRRLFEVLLILSYQHLGIDDEIKKDGNYVMLEAIVKNAKNNNTLKLSRVKNDLDLIREVGNFSAHSLTYTAGKKDIDDIKLKYRVIFEELFNKAGLMT